MYSDVLVNLAMGCPRLKHPWELLPRFSSQTIELQVQRERERLCQKIRWKVWIDDSLISTTKYIIMKTRVFISAATL